MSIQKNSGRWQPGRSGNPAGRKPGTGSVQQLRAQIELLIPEIIQVLTIKAREGDIGAARLLLERVVPALKPLEAPQALQIAERDLSPSQINRRSDGLWRCLFRRGFTTGDDARHCS